MVWNWFKRTVLEPIFGSKTGRFTPLTNKIAADVTGGNTTGNFGSDFMNIAKNATLGGGLLKAGDHMAKAIPGAVDFMQKQALKVPKVGNLLANTVGEIGKIAEEGANIATSVPRILEAGKVSAPVQSVIKGAIGI